MICISCRKGEHALCPDWNGFKDLCSCECREQRSPEGFE